MRATSICLANPSRIPAFLKVTQLPQKQIFKYNQTVKLSDGSTITLKTTSPVKPLNVLARDVLNNPLWNPHLSAIQLDKKAKGLKSYLKRFGEDEFINDDTFDASSDVGFAMGAAKPKVQKVYDAPVETPKKKKK